jgi:hypothetical protein
LRAQDDKYLWKFDSKINECYFYFGTLQNLGGEVIRRISLTSLLMVILCTFAVSCGSNQTAPTPAPSQNQLSKSEIQFLADTYDLCLSVVDNSMILGNAIKGDIAGYEKVILIIEDSQNDYMYWENSLCPSERMRYLWENCKRLAGEWSLYTITVGEYLVGQTPIDDTILTMSSVMDTLSIILNEIDRNGSNWGIPEGSNSITI